MHICIIKYSQNLFKTCQKNKLIFKLIFKILNIKFFARYKFNNNEKFAMKVNKVPFFVIRLIQILDFENIK
jgi:hypothetical protein